MTTLPTPTRRILLSAAQPLVTLVTFAALSATAPAAVITWGTVQSADSDSDISLTTSTSVRALDLGLASGSRTINGVAFLGGVGVSGSNNGNYDVGAGTGTFFGESSNNFTGYGAPVNNANLALSANYGGALSDGRYGTGVGAIATQTLSGLTVGQNYEMQIWFNDVRTTVPGDAINVNVFDSGVAGTSDDVTLRSDDDGLDGAGGRGAVGQWVIGTFTADAATQIFRIDENSGVSGPTMNLFQIRAVPEPSAALLGGLSMLALLRRRR